MCGNNKALWDVCDRGLSVVHTEAGDSKKSHNTQDEGGTTGEGSGQIKISLANMSFQQTII